NGPSGSTANPAASYAAAAGINAAHPNLTVNAPSPASTAPASSPSQDATPNVGDPIDHKKVEGGGGPGRTLLRGVCLFIAVIIIGGIAAYFMFFRGSGAQVVKTTVRNQPVGGQERSVSDDKLTAEAIARTRSQVAPSSTPLAPGAPGAAPPIIVQQPSDAVVPVKVGTTTLNANGNVNASADAP